MSAPAQAGQPDTATLPDALAPESAGLRTVGVEEELLIVDPATGEPLALAGTMLEAAGMPGSMTHELKLEQIEVQTPPCREHGQLLREIASGRRLADRAAQDAGARVAALGTSPLGGSGTFSPGSRFARIGSEFALTALEQLTCALHVHVGVASPEEGVAVLDRVRDWLPLLTALSANSPFWQRADTGYAGFRTQVWGRWPTAGPQELHGTPEVYRSRVEALIGTGVALDEGMVYFDARLSASQPTVELRVADVPLEPAHSALVAILARALVETAAREAADGAAPLGAPASVLRLAGWRASRCGLAGELVHPVRATPVPAAEAVEALLWHLAPVLRESGELPLAEGTIASIFEHGTGARVQREAAAHGGQRAAVHAAIERTAPEPSGAGGNGLP